jgi:hypothetical protein
MHVLICDHYALNARDCIAIATAVNSTPLCTTLSLSNNSALQDEGVVGVCNVLVAGANTTLTTLQMAKVGGGALCSTCIFFTGGVYVCLLLDYSV